MVTEDSSDHCMTEIVPSGEPCPTPGPMREFDVAVHEDGFVPEASIKPLCDAFEIVHMQIQPAFAEFEESSFGERRTATKVAGDRITAAGVQIEHLAEGANPEIAETIEELGVGFREDGERARDGDISDRTTRDLFFGLLRRHDRDCFGLRPEDLAATRAALAGVIVDEFNLPETSEDFFTDDEGSPLEDAINRAAAAGILSGCGDGTFCPDDPATRGLMAVVLARALELPPTDVDHFADDDGSTYEPYINRIAEAGIVVGHRSGDFRANDGLPARQIEDFLSRARRL
jgi:hypothetical protein